MVFGPGKSYQSLWVDDAALAVIDGLAKAPSGTCDIVDDEPLQREELTPALATAARRKWLFRPPTWLFRLLAGETMMFLTRSQRVTNQKFKSATGWDPMIPSARQGLNLLVIEP
jgi:NAD dependent epimerase/dehydratase family enzyme